MGQRHVKFCPAITGLLKMERRRPEAKEHRWLLETGKRQTMASLLEPPEKRHSPVDTLIFRLVMTKLDF